MEDKKLLRFYLQEIRRKRIHDVFLSFRGEDSRASFTSHLYAALQNAGVTVFMDDDSLPRGHQISTSLLRAIEKSHISIIVFSRNYADSRWCLEELKKIMEYHRTIGQVVLPVFYDVDPSEVRRQTGEFGKKFDSLLNRISTDEYNVNVWREALREAGGIAGFVVLNSRNESEAIENIVGNVTRLRDKTDLFIADNPVGVESRVEDMIQLLDNQKSNDVLLLGIWGMGGSGKTTIAKAIYNKIGRNFEGRSFIANVREVWEQDAGQVHLQEQLLSDIFRKPANIIHNIESGKNILKERLHSRKILLVLDDVNKLDQLKALCGSREWFGTGSRIIITTRDKSLLTGDRDNQVCTTKKMDESESLELFSWHAFKQASPREDFAETSRNIVNYSGGLPLALEVLGSYLFDREVSEWENVLEKLQRIPNYQVQNKLRIGYDGLNDDTEKEIFLDIACFFIGMDRNEVIHILNGCELFAEIGINVLVERSLVTVDDENKLGMHDLLRDMGREIIREKSPKDPEERSRLWFHKDVIVVLSNQTGTKAIEGLALKLPSNNTKCFNTKAFEKMKKLRLLQLAGVQIEGDFEYLSRNLSWLCWHGFPLSFIPKNLFQESLVSIELVNSNIKFVWEEAQRMEKLKILNLSHSQHLTQTPNFSNLPNLEKLVLKDCTNLCEVSPSIGHLNKVVLINLKDCTHLRNLPRSIYKLKSLKALILSGCLMIDKLEEDVEQMESLTTLIADNTAITRVPFSLVRSKSIGYISLCGYEGFSRDVFPSIIWSWMSPTNNIFSQVQTSAAGMSSLDLVDEQNCRFSRLLEALKDLSKLQRLWVECDSEIQLNQSVEKILNTLYTTNCGELEATPSTSQVTNNSSALIDCQSQVHISSSKTSSTCLLIQMGMNCVVTNILKEIILQKMSLGSDLLPSDNYPDWLTFNSECSSVIFEVPQVDGRNLKTIMCIVYSSSPVNITSEGLKNVLVINHTRNTIQLYKKDALDSFDEEEWQKVVSNIEPGNEVKMVVVFENGFFVKNIVAYLIYDDEPIDKKAEQHYHEPKKNVVVFGGDENDFSQPEGRNTDHPPSLKKKLNKIKHKDTQSPVSHDMVEKSPEMPGGEATYLSREDGRNILPETKGPQIPPSSIPTRTNIEVPSRPKENPLEEVIPSPPKENPLQQAVVSENEPPQNSIRKIFNPSSPTSEYKTLDTSKEPTIQQEEESPPSTSHVSNNSSALNDCRSQVCMSGSKTSSTPLFIQMGMNCGVTNILREIISQKMSLGCDLLPSDNYPNWLTFKSECSSVTFEVPQVVGRNLKAIMCIIYSSSPYKITSEGLKNLLVINCTKNTYQLYKKDALDSFSEEEWQKVVSNIEPGNEVNVVVVFENEFIVKKTTVYLIYDEPIDKKAEQHYHELDKNAAISGGDENRFGRLFSILPSSVRAVVTSKPFLLGLAGILIGSRCFSDQRRGCKPILREMSAEIAQGSNYQVERDETPSGDVQVDEKRRDEEKESTVQLWMG